MAHSNKEEEKPNAMVVEPLAATDEETSPKNVVNKTAEGQEVESEQMRSPEDSTVLCEDKCFKGSPSNWVVTPASVQAPECRTKEEEMRGFKAFLIITKSLDLAFMISVLLLVFFVNSVAFYPFIVFTVIELLTLLVAILHARTPSLGVLLIYISLEIGKSLAAITLALATVLYDHDKHCAEVKCKTFDFSPVERFRFFWFLISKAAFSMFLCLVAMAHSPQLHDYNSDDDTVPLSF